MVSETHTDPLTCCFTNYYSPLHLQLPRSVSRNHNLSFFAVGQPLRSAPTSMCAVVQRC